MEYIDEFPVVSYRARFQNRIEISERGAELLRDNHTVYWLLRTRCLSPRYHAIARDSEERYRLSVQDVDTAVPLAGPLRAQAAMLLEGETSHLEVVPSDDLAVIRDHLAARGELRDDEPLGQTVLRLLQRQPDPVLTGPTYEPSHAQGLLPTAEVAPTFNDDDIEVVAEPHRPERRSQRLLASMMAQDRA